TTNSSGFFAFVHSIPEAGNYSVRISVPGVTPDQIAVPNLSADTTIQFHAPTAYPVRVRVLDSKGNALRGATIRISRNQTFVSTTGADGSSSFGLLQGAGYTITATLTGYAFQAKSISALQSGDPIDFVGAAALTLRGNVTDSAGAPLSGVSVTLSNGKTA